MIWLFFPLENIKQNYGWKMNGFSNNSIKYEMFMHNLLTNEKILYYSKRWCFFLKIDESALVFQEQTFGS